MTVTNEVVREVLKALDHKNDAIWTDDGSPLVSEVQRLANDKDVTRAQIDASLPGFVRILVEAKENDEPLSLKTTDTPAPASKDGFDPKVEPEVNGAGTPLTEIEVRAILVRRIRDAEQAVMDAKAAVSAAQTGVIRAEQRLNRAVADCQRKFPPVTAAENIKTHLAANQERLRQSVEGAGYNGQSQIDQAMQRSNKRGWTRPIKVA